MLVSLFLVAIQVLHHTAVDDAAGQIAKEADLSSFLSISFHIKLVDVEQVSTHWSV